MGLLLALPSAAQERYANGIPTVRADGTPQWPNGAILKRKNGLTQFPNGNLVRRVDGQLQYPNGSLVRRVSGESQYPNGNLVQRKDGRYQYPNGVLLRKGKQYRSPSGGLSKTPPEAVTVRDGAWVFVFPFKNKRPQTDRYRATYRGQNGSIEFYVDNGKLGLIDASP